MYVFLLSIVVMSISQTRLPVSSRFSVYQGIKALPTRGLHFSDVLPVSELIWIKKEVGSSEGKLEVIDFKIDTEKCKIYPSPFKDYVYFHIPDVPPSGKPGEPQLPMKSFVVKLPIGSKVTGVEVISGNYVKIKNYIKIVPNPKPLLRGKTVGVNQRSGGEYFINPQIYNLNSYFPGKWVDFESGSDNRFSYCFLRLYPLQYNPSTCEAVLITSAKIAVYYQESRQNLGTFLMNKGNEKSIIICPQEFQVQAETLKAFHETELGVPTFIATTEWIATTYDTAPSPPFSGWSYIDTTTPIYGYDFTLARKIINYLRDTSSHPNLENVVIIGDAQKVPPSYYFVWPPWYDAYDFAPSDFLYCSPDYDWVPNYGVGRLSVSNTTELAVIIRKIVDWYPADWSWFKNTIIAGGDPFPNWFPYFDEALLSDCINREYFTGGTNSKYFRSDGRFTAWLVAPHLSNGNLGIFFESGHGSGPGIRFDDGSYIMADEVLAYPVARNLPIVATPACVVGAFDTDIAPGLRFHTSFGEAVLKSKAGGICFFGGTRVNYAGFDYYIDEGRLRITRHRYFNEMFTNIIKSYHSGKNTLGAIYKNTLFEYVSTNDMVTDTLNQWSCFCFTLLGDPCLRIPSQVPGPNYQTPQLFASSPTYYNTRDYPTYHLSTGLDVTINSTTNSPTVKYKLCNAIKAKLAIDTARDNTQPFDYTFYADSGMKFYLVRAESDDKKEGWLYVYTTTGNIVVDGDSRDWDSAGIPPCAQDPDDFSPDDYELITLYVTDDKENWYFGFNGFVSSSWVRYMIAIDCKPDGYTGIEGIDRDALNHWVTFSNNHPVDYEIAVIASPYMVYPLFGRWTGTRWEVHHPFTDLGGYAVLDTATHFLEVMLPKSVIEDPSIMHLSLYSGGWNPSINEMSPALDAVPLDTATYNTPVWGRTYANTITSFVTVYETGVSENTKSQITSPKLVVYPNPLHKDVVIHFEGLSTSQPINLVIYDLCGRVVYTNSHYEQTEEANNSHHFKVQLDHLPSGIYFMRVEAGEYRITKKLVITH